MEFKDYDAMLGIKRRAACDDIAQRHASGQPFEPPPWLNTAS